MMMVIHLKVSFRSTPLFERGLSVIVISSLDGVCCGSFGTLRKNRTERVKKVKDDVIEVEAVVIDSLPNAMFSLTSSVWQVGATHG